jgi:CHAT domain-containing protein
MQDDDGLLTPAEVLDLRLAAPLVVLSACDTGRGRITGDGVVGLSRSFLAAGAAAVVMSLWSIPDGPTADLMLAFYTALSQGHSPPAALRQAMLRTRQNHPAAAAWAGFVVTDAGFRLIPGQGR